MFFILKQSHGRVWFPHGISLTAYNLKDLECCEIGEKGDSSFILKLLLALYSRDDLRLKSITGKPSRNKKYVQDKGEKFTPEKLQFIKGMYSGVNILSNWIKNVLPIDKFRERVHNEQTLPTEMEKRCRDERVHKIINTKIQNLKRKRLKFEGQKDRLQTWFSCLIKNTHHTLRISQTNTNKSKIHPKEKCYSYIITQGYPQGQGTEYIIVKF